MWLWTTAVLASAPKPKEVKAALGASFYSSAVQSWVRPIAETRTWRQGGATIHGRGFTMDLVRTPRDWLVVRAITLDETWPGRWPGRIDGEVVLTLEQEPTHWNQADAAAPVDSTEQLVGRLGKSLTQGHAGTGWAFVGLPTVGRIDHLSPDGDRLTWPALGLEMECQPQATCPLRAVTISQGPALDVPYWLPADEWTALMGLSTNKGVSQLPAGDGVTAEITHGSHVRFVHTPGSSLPLPDPGGEARDTVTTARGWTGTCVAGGCVHEGRVRFEQGFEVEASLRLGSPQGEARLTWLDSGDTWVGPLDSAWLPEGDGFIRSNGFSLYLTMHEGQPGDRAVQIYDAGFRLAGAWSLSTGFHGPVTVRWSGGFDVLQGAFEDDHPVGELVYRRCELCAPTARASYDQDGTVVKGDDLFAAFANQAFARTSRADTRPLLTQLRDRPKSEEIPDGLFQGPSLQARVPPDRRELFRDKRRGLERAAARINEACGSDLKVQMHWNSFTTAQGLPDEPYKGERYIFAATACSIAVDHLAKSCATPLSRDVVAQLRSIRCRYDTDPGGPSLAVRTSSRSLVVRYQRLGPDKHLLADWLGTTGGLPHALVLQDDPELVRAISYKKAMLEGWGEIGAAMGRAAARNAVEAPSCRPQGSMVPPAEHEEAVRSGLTAWLRQQDPAGRYSIAEGVYWVAPCSSEIHVYAGPISAGESVDLRALAAVVPAKVPITPEIVVYAQGVNSSGWPVGTESQAAVLEFVNEKVTTGGKTWQSPQRTLDASYGRFVVRLPSRTPHGFFLAVSLLGHIPLTPPVPLRPPRQTFERWESTFVHE